MYSFIVYQTVKINKKINFCCSVIVFFKQRIRKPLLKKTCTLNMTCFFHKNGRQHMFFMVKKVKEKLL